MLKCRTLEEKMTETEKKAWQPFRGVVKVFLGKNEDLSYKEIVKALITTNQRMGCHMSLKLHFYTLILISLKKILGTLARNTARNFTKIFSQWKSGISAAGSVQ